MTSTSHVPLRVDQISMLLLLAMTTSCCAQHCPSWHDMWNSVSRYRLSSVTRQESRPLCRFVVMHSGVPTITEVLVLSAFSSRSREPIYRLMTTTQLKLLVGMDMFSLLKKNKEHNSTPTNKMSSLIFHLHPLQINNRPFLSTPYTHTLHTHRPRTHIITGTHRPPH